KRRFWSGLAGSGRGGGVRAAPALATAAATGQPATVARWQATVALRSHGYDVRHLRTKEIPESAGAQLDTCRQVSRADVDHLLLQHRRVHEDRGLAVKMHRGDRANRHLMIPCELLGVHECQRSAAHELANLPELERPVAGNQQDHKLSGVGAGYHALDYLREPYAALLGSCICPQRHLLVRLHDEVDASFPQRSRDDVVTH